MNRVFVFCIVLFFFVVLSSFPATLINHHLFVDIDDDTGRISLCTVEGIDTVTRDERQELLFFDRPPSSYTLIYVDGDVFEFGGKRGRFVERPITIDDSVLAVWHNGQVSVSKVVRFVRRKKTGVEDGVLIVYIIQNISGKGLEIALQELFDTCLGEQDRFHFVLSDRRGLEFETMLGGENLPVSWDSRDENCTICLRGTFHGDLVTTPCKVIFANYRSLRENPFNYHVYKTRRFDNLPYSKNDSAVALYYGPVILRPGEKVEFTTLLGLCGEGEYEGKQEEIVEVMGTPFLKEEVADTQVISTDKMEEVSTFIDSLERINEIIKTLNRALEREDKAINKDQLIEIRNELNQMKKDSSEN